MTDELAPLTERQQAGLARMIERTPAGGTIWTSPDMTLAVADAAAAAGRGVDIVEVPDLEAGSAMSIGELPGRAEGGT